MRKFAFAAVVGVVVAALGLGSVANAEKLTSEQATRLTEQWAKEKCKRTRGCVKYAGRYCYPLSKRKRRCIAQIVIREPNGNLVQCETRLFWVLPRGESKPELRRRGPTRCES